jgi:DNA-binding IscR family transcriptional regulator
MAMNTQFSIAVHIMAGLASAAPREVPSWEIASSVNTNPAFVRRILAKLSCPINKPHLFSFSDCPHTATA